MRYTVTISDYADDIDGRERWHYFDGLTLTQAWRIANRHARRGVKLFGGTIERANWGARGGSFPHAYRAATIRVGA